MFLEFCTFSGDTQGRFNVNILSATLSFETLDLLNIFLFSTNFQM